MAGEGGRERLGRVFSSAGRLQGGRMHLSCEPSPGWGKQVGSCKLRKRAGSGRAELVLSWSRSQRSYQVTCCLLTVWNTSMCRFRSALVLSSLAELQLCLLALGALAALVCCGIWASLGARQTPYQCLTHCACICKKVNFHVLCEASEVQRTVQQHSAER